MVRAVLLLVTAGLALTGCSTPLEGTLRDGTSGAPVAAARVTLHWRGWGWVDGTAVWDKDKSETTVTGPDGRFRFRHDGGIGIDAVAPSHRPQRAETLSRGMTLYIGGPWPGMAADRTILVPLPGRPLTREVREQLATPVALPDIGLRASGPAMTDASGRLVLEGARDIRLAFIPGSGAIPAPPRDASWEERLELDLARDAGWAFLRRGDRLETVLRIAPLGFSETAAGERAGVMRYTPINS